MKQSLGFLAKIAFTSTIMAIMIVFYLRQRASSQDYAGHNHPILEQWRGEISAVQRQTLDRPSLEELIASERQERPDSIVFLKLFISHDLQPVVAASPILSQLVTGADPPPQVPPSRLAPGSKNNSNPITGKGARMLNQPTEYRPSRYLPLPRLEKLDPGAFLTLDRLFEIWPEAFWVMDIQNNVPEVNDVLIPTLKKANRWKQVAVTTLYDPILEDLKKKEPLWFFGAGFRQKTRLRLLATFFLAPMASLDADFYIYERELQRDPMTYNNLSRELQRRHKHLLLRQDKSDSNREIYDIVF